MNYQMNQRPSYMPYGYPSYGTGIAIAANIDMRDNQQSLGMAYVPWQEWKGTYDLAQGFSAGTIFPELDLRFTGRDK